MKLSIKQGEKFIPADEGTWRGVCVDVTPLVEQKTKFGIRKEFRIVFETDGPEREDGIRQCVWSRGFTPSLYQSNFRKFLEQWKGRNLTKEEEDDFETESLIGQPEMLVVGHKAGKEDGVVYANIVACTPYRGSAPLTPSGKFKRKKDREANGEEANYRKAASAQTPKGEAVDDTQAGADWMAVKVYVENHDGVELRDLDESAIEKLLENWLPSHNANLKATADDKRLAAALIRAKEYLAQLQS